ncbi:MAG: hypothetical protein K2X38_14255 [Gemmataceae bacterium]|nr:hypothetical protein [Gemmataceae bacterium]
MFCFSQLERQNYPVISEGTLPSEEIGVLRKIEPRINEVVRDLAMNRTTLHEAADMIGPVVHDSTMRHALMLFEGRSEAEKLARMLLFWAQLKIDELGNDEAAKATDRLAGEFESLFPGPSLPPSLARRHESLQ